MGRVRARALPLLLALAGLALAPAGAATHEAQPHEPPPDEGVLVEACAPRGDAAEECLVLGVADPLAGVERKAPPWRTTSASVTIRYERTPFGCAVTGQADVAGADPTTTYSWELGTFPPAVAVGAVGEAGPVVRALGPFTAYALPGSSVTWYANIQNDQKVPDRASVAKTLKC